MKNLDNLTLNTYLISGFIFGGLIGYVSTETFLSIIVAAFIGLIFGTIFNKIAT